MAEQTILIAEDDPDIRDGVRILLSGEGYHIIEAENGTRALEVFRPEVDLVILDIMMPGMSGLRVCEELRKLSTVPILFLTAKSQESDKLLGYDVTTLSGSFPAAQLNKASSLGLRAGLSAVQGQGLTLEDAAVLFYNALTASTAENQTYAATLGFTVTDGRIDLSSVLLSSVEGPFVADGTTQLPFAPAAVYRNDTVATDAALNAYDVYYYSASARTV